jgi:hypothetical protein
MTDFCIGLISEQALQYLWIGLISIRYYISIGLSLEDLLSG